METGIFHKIFLIYKNLVFISSREEDVGAKYKYNSGLEGKYRNIYQSDFFTSHYRTPSRQWKSPASEPEIVEGQKYQESRREREWSDPSSVKSLMQNYSSEQIIHCFRIRAELSEQSYNNKLYLLLLKKRFHWWFLQLYSKSS